MQKINKVKLLILSLLVSTTMASASNKENRIQYDKNKNVYGFYNCDSKRLSPVTASKHNGSQNFIQAREDEKYREARAMNNHSPKKPANSPLSDPKRRVVGSASYSAFKNLK